MANILQWLALGSYGVAHFLFIGNFFTGKKTLINMAVKITAIACFIHFVAIITKGTIIGKIPIVTLSEIISGIAFLIMCIYLELHRRIKLEGIGFVTTFLAAMALLVSIMIETQSSPFMTNPVFNGIWFGLHTTALFLSYSIFTAAFSTASVYLIQERLLKSKTKPGIASRLPSLNVLDVTTNNLVTFAFPLLTIGLIAGILWAGQIWKHYWEWEPKQTLALLTWLIYAFYLIARTIMGWKGRQIILLNVIGFLLILTTFLGVNLCTYGKHKFI